MDCFRGDRSRRRVAVVGIKEVIVEEEALEEEDGWWSSGDRSEEW